MKQDGEEEQGGDKTIYQSQNQQEAEARVGRQLLPRPLYPTNPPIVLALSALPPLRG